MSNVQKFWRVLAILLIVILYPKILVAIGVTAVVSYLVLCFLLLCSEEWEVNNSINNVNCYFITYWLVIVPVKFINTIINQLIK